MADIGDRDAEAVHPDRAEEAAQAAAAIAMTIRANEVDHAEGDDWFAGGLERDVSSLDPGPGVPDAEV